MLFENPVLLNMRLRMQPRSVKVANMAGIFAKRIWQPYDDGATLTNTLLYICRLVHTKIKCFTKSSSHPLGRKRCIVSLFTAVFAKTTSTHLNDGNLHKCWTSAQEKVNSSTLKKGKTHMKVLGIYWFISVCRKR